MQLADQLYFDECCAASKPPTCTAGMLSNASDLGACSWRKQRLQGCNRGGAFIQSVLLPCRWFEVDQLEVIQYKARLLKSAGAATKVSHAQQVSANDSQSARPGNVA